LKQDVGGRLIPVTSPLAPCKEAPGSAASLARLQELKNPYFIGEQPGGTQVAGWLDAWTSTPSVYAVAAQNTADIVAAVNFARDNKLRLVIKGGGHSYLGLSNAPDSLLVWTRDMHAIELHDAFVPTGCKVPPRPAVTIGAGARWLQAYDAVTTRGGRYVQGGGCCTVGVVGLLAGGGFGTFSKHYGMAAASLLEAEVVTADGKVRIANACTHADLFWALKGGVGGSFGVVTRVTLATHELPKFFGWAEGRIQAKSDTAFRKLVGRFLTFYEQSLLHPPWGEVATFGRDNSLKIGMSAVGLTEEQGRAAWKPFKDFVGASPGDFEITQPIKFGAIPARHCWDSEWRKKHSPGAMIADPRPAAPAGNVWWSGNSGEVNIFLHGYESLWLPASLFRDQERLADAVYQATRHYAVAFHFNKGLAGAPADKIAAARDTATNPAVLDAFALVIIANGSAHSNPGVPGHEPDMAKGKAEASAITAAADKLRAIVPNAGAYANESNYFDRSFQNSYWGPHYPRLAEVKKKYDPDGLFFVHHGVGSESWSADGFTRLTPA
jgi:FAD/FMN-containing dehydrogenase